MSVSQDIITWIDAELRARGLPNRALAAHMGWSDSRISKVMHRGRNLLASELLEVFQFFGYSTPVDEAYEGSDLAETTRLVSAMSPVQRAALLAYLRAASGTDPEPAPQPA